MRSLLQANPDIIGADRYGNDEMALGAIAALKEAGKLEQVKVGGFDGSPDAVAAIKAGELRVHRAFSRSPCSRSGRQAGRQRDQDRLYRRRRPSLLFDCLLITKDNVDKYTAPFVLSE